jgi:hypothetical protein
VEELSGRTPETNIAAFALYLWSADQVPSANCKASTLIRRFKVAAAFKTNKNAKTNSSHYPLNAPIAFTNNQALVSIFSAALAAFLSAFQASIFAFISVSGITSSIFNGILLKGS